MPRSKDFSHRLDIIDACLRNNRRRWDAAALLEEVNRQLEERWGKKISRRTLFDDLKYLQEELDAPVEKETEAGRVFYRYADAQFSIKQLPVSAEDVGYLKNAAALLRQVGGPAVMPEVEAIIAKLEQTAQGENRGDAAIQFEAHTAAQGGEYLDDLLQAIKEQTTLRVLYQPFSAAEAEIFPVHPYLLKQYRARWFLIARRDGSKQVSTFALDRIRSVRPAGIIFQSNDLFDPETFYAHLIGVSYPKDAVVEEVRIRVNGRQCDYVRTKPIHHTQMVEEESGEACMIVTLRVVNNYELRSVLMGYGADVEVLAPVHLREQLADMYRSGFALYW